MKKILLISLIIILLMPSCTQLTSSKTTQQEQADETPEASEEPTETENDELSLANAAFEIDGIKYTEYTGKPWIVIESEYSIRAAKDRKNGLELYISENQELGNIALVKPNGQNNGIYTIYFKEGYTLLPPSEENINIIVVDINQGPGSPQRFVVEDETIVKQVADALNREQKDIIDLISYVCTIHFLNSENYTIHVSTDVYKTETEYYLFNTIDYSSSVLDEEEIEIILSIIE